MSSATAADSLPHVALYPTSGAGHLVPFLRLAATLIRRHCKVTLIIAQPTVSVAETRLISRFLAAFPQADEKHFTPLPLATETVNTTDPFCLRWEAMRRSAHLLSPILSSLSPPLSVLISDSMLVSSTIPVTHDLQIQSFVLFPSSPPLFSLYSNFPVTCKPFDAFDLPGWSQLPPIILLPQHYIVNMYKQNGLVLERVDGVLMNSFQELETIGALQTNETMSTKCPVFRVGLFPPEEFEKEASEGAAAAAAMEWLEKQVTSSVVYVGFGNRTAMGIEQIRELASGLVKSGSKFLWVLKTTVVDKEEETSMEEILGVELMEEIEKFDRGFVFNGWVNQAEILGHRAVGGFISHCGWNSVTEAAWNGVPVVAWPQQEEQKINAALVEAGGWGRVLNGLRMENDRSVAMKAEAVAETVKEVMGSEGLKSAAAAVGEAAKKAIGGSGSSDENWKQIFHMWNN